MQFRMRMISHRNGVLPGESRDPAFAPWCPVFSWTIPFIEQLVRIFETRVDTICKPEHRTTRMAWSAHQTIKTRREALALSQSALSQQTGIPKSLLSLIEAGKRKPTDAQVEALA